MVEYFAERHIGRYDQICVINADVDAVSAFLEAQNSLRSGGLIHTFVLLNVLSQAQIEPIPANAMAADQIILSRHPQGKQLTDLFSSSVNTCSSAVGRRVIENGVIPHLHLDHSGGRENPLTSVLNVKGMGTGIDTRPTTETLTFNNGAWSMRSDSEISKDKSHCVYASPGSVVLFRDTQNHDGNKAGDGKIENPPSLHISGTGDRLVYFYYNYIV